MKKLSFALLACLFAITATAGDIANSTSNNQTQSSTSTASTNGNQQNITFASAAIPTQTTVTENLNESGTTTLRNVPSVSGPNLTSSNDTCMGSSSGSLNVPGFGVSVGSTWADTNCKLLKNARELWNMGMRAASLALMCNDPMNKDALESTGFQCPEKRTDPKLKMSTSIESKP